MKKRIGGILIVSGAILLLNPTLEITNRTKLGNFL